MNSFLIKSTCSCSEGYELTLLHTEELGTFKCVLEENGVCRIADICYYKDSEGEYIVITEYPETQGQDCESLEMIVPPCSEFPVDDFPSFTEVDDGFTSKSASFNAPLDIMIYPNPLVDKIGIDLPTELKVFKTLITDVNGRVIKEIDFNISKTKRKIVNLDLKDLDSGVYTITIVSEKGGFVEKIVKL